MPKTETTNANQCKSWADHLKAGLSTNLAWLKPPPDECDDLSTLLDARQLFLLTDQLEFPNIEAAKATADKLCSLSRKGMVEDLVLECLTSIQKRITELSMAGKKDSRIIPSSAFGDVRIFSFQSAGFSGPHERPLCCGLLNSLKPGWEHLREVVPLENAYLFAGRGTPSQCLVLGPAQRLLNGAHTARDFYRTDQVISATAYFHRQQAEKFQSEDAETKREQEAELRKFWNSDLGTWERKRKLLEKLRGENRLPVEVTDAPAVRVGGGEWSTEAERNT